MVSYRFCSCIADLVSKSHLLQLRIDTLNSIRLVICYVHHSNNHNYSHNHSLTHSLHRRIPNQAPKKDYEHDRLLAGQLQLAKGTNLIVDETTLEEGQLVDKGEFLHHEQQCDPNTLKIC